MNLDPWASLVGLGCAVFSITTWFLFKPRTTFHAPQSKTMTILLFACVGVGVVTPLLNLANAIPVEFFPGLSKQVPGLATALFLTVTYGRAVRHHIEHATRTPRDLWAAFFGTDK